jgi:putative transposase
MLQLARAIVGVARDALRLVVSFLRSSSAIRAENLILRKQLASYIERGIKPRRLNHATRVSLALFTRVFHWRVTVVNVQPATIVRWHRMGWRIFWRRKSRAGPTTDSARAAEADSPDGRRESVVGRGANCQ